MTESLDPRLTPARPHVADLRLRDRVAAARYVAGTPLRVTAPSAPLRREPDPGAGLDTESTELSADAVRAGVLFPPLRLRPNEAFPSSMGLGR